VIVKAVQGRRSIKVGRICWKGRFLAWSEKWRSDGWWEWWWWQMSWQVNEEVSRNMTGEADGLNQGVDSRDGVMHIWMSDLWFSMRRWLVGEKGDNRWGAGTATGLNWDQITISKVYCCRNFVTLSVGFLLSESLCSHDFSLNISYTIYFRIHCCIMKR